MATIAEQLAAAPLTDTLKHPSIPSEAEWPRLPWALSRGSDSESGWSPPGYSVAGLPTGSNGGWWLAAAPLGKAAFSMLRRGGAFGHIGTLGEERQFSTWLFYDGGGLANGYQLPLLQTGTVDQYKFVLRKWINGVEVVLGETSPITMTQTGAFALVRSGGKVSAWVQEAEGGKWTLVGAEVADSTFTSGYSGIDGNGSNPTLINFSTGPLEGGEVVVPQQLYVPEPIQQLTVVSIAEGGAGRGFDLTDQVEGLNYSNVDPGGDEVATFTVRRPWFDNSPELARGNLLRISNGIDVLWQGRIEESDRSADNTETIAVTAYGLGVRLKDGNFREIFIDRDLTKWGEPTTQRKIDLINSGYSLAASATVTASGAGAASASLFMDFTGVTAAGLNEGVELLYFGMGIELGHLLFDQIGDTTTTWLKFADLWETDVGTGGGIDSSPNYSGFNENTNQGTHASGARFYAIIQAFYTNAGFAGQMTNKQYWPNVMVMGRHGLTWQGTWPNLGFTVDQMVSFIVNQVAGVSPRVIDAQSFVVEQAVYADPQPHEEAIKDLNRFENCNWGTWGPESPLERSAEGHFDFTSPDPTTQHWSIPRQDCDSEDLHSETATLFGAVDVVYTDEAEVQRVLRVERDVPDLDAAEMTRVYTLNIGQATAAIAQAEGEGFLNVWGQFAPARGTFTVSAPVRHYRRGRISPLYLRADGSNVRIPDILPAATLFALDATPDRRTTFPIKRVSVDASGQVAVASVEVDQADDSLSVLQARSDLSNSLIPTA